MHPEYSRWLSTRSGPPAQSCSDSTTSLRGLLPWALRSGAETRTPQATAPTAAVTAADLITETGWLVAGLVTVAALTLLLLSTGPPALARMTAALGGNVPAVRVLQTIDAIRLEVGRYYATLALINLSLGVATTIAMWSLHMPTPMLWGAMAAVLNFIPYLGFRGNAGDGHHRRPRDVRFDPAYPSSGSRIPGSGDHRGPAH